MLKNFQEMHLMQWKMCAHLFLDANSMQDVVMGRSDWNSSFSKQDTI